MCNFHSVFSSWFWPLRYLQARKAPMRSPERSFSSTEVLTSMEQTKYGSMFEAGLLSSM